MLISSSTACQSLNALYLFHKFLRCRSSWFLRQRWLSRPPRSPTRTGSSTQGGMSALACVNSGSRLLGNGDVFSQGFIPPFFCWLPAGDSVAPGGARATGCERLESLSHCMETATHRMEMGSWTVTVSERHTLLHWSRYILSLFVTATGVTQGQRCLEVWNHLKRI